MTFVTQNIPWIILAVITGGMLLWPMMRGSGRYGISPSEAVMLINKQDAVVIDVREKTEFDSGHLPNARNIPCGDIEKRTNELNKFKERPIIVVCQTGVRAHASLMDLRKAGFEQLACLTGGIDGWRQAGQPLVLGNEAKK